MWKWFQNLRSHRRYVTDDPPSAKIYGGTGTEAQSAGDGLDGVLLPLLTISVPMLNLHENYVRFIFISIPKS